MSRQLQDHTPVSEDRRVGIVRDVLKGLLNLFHSNVTFLLPRGSSDELNTHFTSRLMNNSNEYLQNVDSQSDIRGSERS